MGARFAGSQRLGDRRRRRLAVETDEHPDNAGRKVDLPASPGSARLADDAHADGEESGKTALPFELPISRLIPRNWWTYLVGGTACLVLGAALLIAGWNSAKISTALGPGFERLVGFSEAPVLRWMACLLLSASAQLALVIWWARSKSQKDFEGRYWLWIRVACAWFSFGGCFAIGMQAVLDETIRHFLPEISSRAAALGWLIPALAFGLAIVLPLTREMRACKWSRSLILLAAGSFLTAAGLHMEVGSLTPTTAIRLLLVYGCLLAGCLFVFMSMWLHARHVLHCTADPAIQAKSTWRIPRPHFRLPRLGRTQKASTEPQADVALPSRRKRREGTSEAQSVAEVKANSDATSARENERAAGKPHFRIDARHESQPEATENASADEPTAGSGTGAQMGRSDDGSAPQSHAATKSAVAPAAASETYLERQDDEDESDNGFDDSEEASSKPDLRGLSKKQRRRLMQQQRERERGASR